jgi:hypothetical protein
MPSRFPTAALLAQRFKLIPKNPSDKPKLKATGKGEAEWKVSKYLTVSSASSNCWDRLVESKSQYSLMIILQIFFLLLMWQLHHYVFRNIS